MERGRHSERSDFPGVRDSGQVDQARANADSSQANLDLLKESIMLEVEQDYFSLKEADERIAATSKLVEQAEESLTLAEKQYSRRRRQRDRGLGRTARALQRPHHAYPGAL